MSFILDALRKSETQNQKQLGPGFANVRRGNARRSMPVWVPILALLLIVNIIALSVAFWPDPVKNVPPLVESNDAVAIDGPETETVPGGEAQTRGEIRPLSREISRGRRAIPESPIDIPAVDQKNSGGSVQVMSEEEMNLFLSPVEETIGVADNRQTGIVTELLANEVTAAELLPDLAELRLRGILTLPELHLDVHVYSETQADRFVFVNMKKYREGDRLREGPLLESITPQGAIMQHQGQRFVVIQD